MAAVLDTAEGHVGLAWDLREIAGQPLTQVIIWPQYDERDGGHRRLWTVLAIGLDGREVPLPGRMIPVINLLRRTFPLAEWGRAQRYRVRTGVLTRYTPRQPECLRNAGGAVAQQHGRRSS